MDMKETTKAEDEPEMKIRRKIASFDDDELWAGFEWEETDRILNGEIKPKTLITTYLFGYNNPRYPQKGALIAQEMLSVFPNSKFMRRGKNSEFTKVIELAKKRGFTSLILAHTNNWGHDQICIINLLNCASATFRIYDLIPREEIPNRVNPPSRFYPMLQMKNFESPASVGTARVLQSLFPKVPPSHRRSSAYFLKHNNLIYFRHNCFCYKEALAGESSSTRTKGQECGPRFSLKLEAVEKVSFETGNTKEICMGD